MTVLTPAWRDFRSKKEVLRAFNTNQDFILKDDHSPRDGIVVNRAQLKRDGHTKVEIRYDRSRKTVIAHTSDRSY
jgi:hypothetical protein